MDKITLNYYNAHAKDFVQGTVAVDFSITQDRFLAQLEKHDCNILSIMIYLCGAVHKTAPFFSKIIDSVFR